VVFIFIFSIFFIFFTQGFAVQCGYLSYIIMQTSLLLSLVIKLVTQGREGVLRTTTEHIRRSMAGGCMG
jgi:hypothetical protein